MDTKSLMVASDAALVQMPPVLNHTERVAMGYSLFDILGVDEGELEWEDLAMCRGMDREMFYSQYESDPDIAVLTDQVCASCPVLAQCLQTGVDNSEYGVWGGWYLTAGKVDESRNSHKTAAVKKQLRARLVGK